MGSIGVPDRRSVPVSAHVRNKYTEHNVATDMREAESPRLLGTQFQKVSSQPKQGERTIRKDAIKVLSSVFSNTLILLRLVRYQSNCDKDD